jgi:hypothetical protein
MIRAFVAPFVGAVLAVLLSLGVAYTSTKAPSTNPANAPILTYGTSAGS